MLVVEVGSARDLMPKDGQGSVSAYVLLSFDGMQRRTNIREKGLNPVWDETICFVLSNPSNIQKLVLEACVHNANRSRGPSSLLGKVRIGGNAFAHSHNAVVIHYPLGKRGMFSSHAKGELGLKVYITIEASVRASNPLPGMDSVICPLSALLLHDQSSRPHGISFHHLKKITKNFSNDRILGQGGCGVVYKGVLQNGEVIAVKKIVSSVMPGLEKQFANEVCHLMMVKHPNIVRCVGYCFEIHNECLEHNGKYIFAEMAERLLCLEYLPNGSLDKYLLDECSKLDWSTCYKIIEGVCCGLCHLHEQIDKPIIHLDLKPANILLDGGMVPKITDFGLSRLIGQQQTICTSSRNGTFGYMAPEFLHGGTITPKSDIFSLGVIILEVITGHRDYPDTTRTSSNDFVELTIKKWRSVLRRLPEYGSVEMDCQQIKRCIRVGLICVNPDRTKRPPIAKVISMLQGLEGIDSEVSNEATSETGQRGEPLHRSLM